MVNQIAVGNADFARHGLQSHPVRTVGDEQATRALQRFGASFVRRPTAPYRALLRR